MFDYLKQFKSLPKELREKISSPAAMFALAELEKKYKVILASTVMKVMVKIIALRNLPSFLVTEFSLSPEAAENLSKELKEKIFFSVSGYLGLKASSDQAEKQAKEIINQAKINFSQSDLEARCHRVMTTFLRGIRSRIDTRSALEKSVEAGGLGLDRETVDHLLKTSYSFIANLEPKATEEKKIPVSSSDLTDSDALTKIISQEELSKEKDFDLKKEIATGRTPSLAAPDKVEEITAREEVKSLASPESEKEEEKPAEKKDDRMGFAPPPKAGLVSSLFKSPKAPVSQAVPEPPTKKEDDSKISEKASQVAKEKKTEAAWSSKPRPVSDSDSKTKIEDIKAVPKVMGPIDELRYLDLINFRRLGESPEEVTLKIKNKIELLEKEGYDKRLKAVLAWKKSPVSRLYVKIGQEAIGQGISLKKAAENRQEKNQESLSWEEIKAIVALNSILSF